MAQIRPFVPPEAFKNPDGTISTERLITVQAPDGQWMNIPTLWMTPSGPLELGEQESAAVALRYEQMTRQPFPRFSKLTDAVTAAQERSKAGGIASGVLGGAIR